MYGLLTAADCHRVAAERQHWKSTFCGSSDLVKSLLLDSWTATIMNRRTTFKDLFMSARPAYLQSYIEAAQELFLDAGVPPAARAVATSVFERLQSTGNCAQANTSSLEACEYLDVVLHAHFQADTAIGQIACAIRDLRPLVSWFSRVKGNNGSENFLVGHANAMICGPGGLEDRDDVHLGFTIMAPGVRYPDHCHPGEEAYVLLTAGEFRMDDGAWFDPGIGGGLYNAPWTQHAMRSGDTPLLTLWCLKL